MNVLVTFILSLVVNSGADLTTEFIEWVMLILLLVSGAIWTIFIAYSFDFVGHINIILMVILAIAFIGTISLAWRRAHDAGLSGILMLIPIVSLIVSILPSRTKNNPYLTKKR